MSEERLRRVVEDLERVREKLVPTVEGDVEAVVFAGLRGALSAVPGLGGVLSGLVTVVPKSHKQRLAQALVRRATRWREERAERARTQEEKERAARARELEGVVSAVRELREQVEEEEAEVRRLDARVRRLRRLRAQEREGERAREELDELEEAEFEEAGRELTARFTGEVLEEGPGADLGGEVTAKEIDSKQTREVEREEVVFQQPVKIEGSWSSGLEGARPSQEETGKATAAPDPMGQPQTASEESSPLVTTERPTEFEGSSGTDTTSSVTEVVDDQIAPLEAPSREAVERASKLVGFTLLGVESHRYRHETTGLVFRLIPGGSYLMGSPKGVGFSWERPQHEVRVEPFLLCETPCTQGAWDQIAKEHGIEDKRWWKGEELPIEGVSWEEVRRWCTEVGLRLPSEAEWEYACRAGSTGAYCFGESEEELRDYAWFLDNSGRRTNPVGQKKPNAWGLHDMHGNVWEWCEDDWGDNYEGAPSVGWPAREVAGASGRVLRGGSWFGPAFCCRSACRFGFVPGLRDGGLGFRPARSLP